MSRFPTSEGRKEDQMCVYEKAVMYCLYLEVRVIHRREMEHFTRFSHCYTTSGSLHWKLIVALVPYCAGCI